MQASSGTSTYIKYPISCPLTRARPRHCRPCTDKCPLGVARYAPGSALNPLRCVSPANRRACINERATNTTTFRRGDGRAVHSRKVRKANIIRLNVPLPRLPSSSSGWTVRDYRSPYTRAWLSRLCEPSFGHLLARLVCWAAL